MSQRWTAAILALLCAVAVAALPAAAQNTGAAARSMDDLNKYLGLAVREVRFPNLSEDDEAKLRELIPLKMGEHLTRKNVRESIKTLFATERFADVAADAGPAGDGGVRLTFITRANYFIGSITVEGAPRPPSANQLVNASKLELGELFTPDKPERGINRIKRTLEDHGYYQPKVTTTFDFRDPDQQVDIIFYVNPGAQAVIGQVEVTGDAGISNQEALSIAKMRPGTRVTADRVRRALERIRKYYQKRGRLVAQASITDRTYRPETNTVDYTFKLDRGPKVEIEVEGASLRRGLLKRYVPVFEENALDDDLLNEGRRNLRDYFQSKGFFEVKADISRAQDKASDRVVVVYDVNTGERHKLTDLTIQGNHYFDDATIRERMRVAPSSLLLFYGRFSQALLASDVEAIKNLYRDNGFRNIEAATEVEDDYKGERGRMRVGVNINEGPQSLVKSLEIAGNAGFSMDELRQRLNSLEGQPYSEANVASDRDSIVNFYYERGYPDVKFEATADALPEDPTSVRLRYKITEGKMIRVDRVLVSGLENTRPYVVRREFQLKPGDPLSRTDMLDTQRRLYDLGIFNEVNIAVQNPEGDTPEKNVLIQVEEARRYTFTYGFGLEVQTGGVSNGLPQGRTGVSPRVSFDITRTNFMGRNHTVLLKTRVGRLQQRALVSYEAPRWFNQEALTLTFTSFFDKTQDVRTFTAERLEGAAQLQQVVSKKTTLLYRASYRRVQTSDLRVNINLVPLLAQTVRVGMPSITYIRDTRDDPIESHHGWYITADFGVATGLFGSENNFGKFLLQNASYHPFKKKRWVLARNTRIGIEKPYGSVSEAFVPLPERFFSGGGSSHRGFAINQAGPRDPLTGFPLGGEGLFTNSIELRTPPIALPYLGENVSAVFFHDAGNVFSTSSDILPNLFRISQRNKSSCRDDLDPAPKCDFDYTSHAIGAGLRYRTPIGPVRIDFGYNLNPPIFPIREPGPARHQRLSRFNIYFSIGQTF